MALERRKPLPRLACYWCGGNSRSITGDGYNYGWVNAGFCSLACAERFAMQALAQGFKVDPVAAGEVHANRPYMGKAKKGGA